MAFQPTDLRSIPLFTAIPDDHLGKLAAVFARRSLTAGEVLFAEGALADRLILLVEGEIEVSHGKDRLTIRPIAPVGEVGALAGLRRATTAVAVVASGVLELPSVDLVTYFQLHGTVGLRFHDNLLHILADKIQSDRRRMDEMRVNLIETQKAMKWMQAALLDDDDTPLHKRMFEELDALIENNKRGHYLVDVPRALPTRLRLDDGSLREVVRMSNEQLHVRPGAGKLPARGDGWSAVLVFPDGDIPITGTVEASAGEDAVLTVGLLIEEYAQLLERHVARLQLLDVVL